MSKNNVTMKDIAREANVSVATVSYVLNYSKAHKVSDDTRLKVFEIAKKLKYVPNTAAKVLAGKNLRSQIGIMVDLNPKNSKSRMYYYYDIINALQRCIHKYSYDVVLVSSKELGAETNIMPSRTLAGVILIDIEDDKLPIITKDIYVPCVFINSYYDNLLFYKILTDYKKVITKAKKKLGNDLYVITEEFSNSYNEKIIREEFDDKDIFINNKSNNIVDFLAKKDGRKGIVFGEILGSLVEKLIDNRDIIVVTGNEKDSILLPDTKRIIVSNKKKAEISMEVMHKLINFKFKTETEKIIYVDPM